MKKTYLLSLIIYCLAFSITDDIKSEVRNPATASNYLVLGSYLEKSRAVAEMERITDTTGTEILSIPITIGGRNYHRILIGPVHESEEASYRAVASQADIEDAWILRNVPNEGVAQTKFPLAETPMAGRADPTPTKDPLPDATTNSFSFSSPGESHSPFSGYVKSFAVAQDEISTDFLAQKTTYQLQNSVRLMWEKFGDTTIWQIHYEISPVFVSRQQPIEGSTFNIVGDSYRLTDIQSSLSDEDNKNQLYQNLDRLNLQWQFERGDLTIGRQAISFGSARFINPTDIFLPFNVQTFNQEYRTGVDAIRYQSPLGELGEFDVGIVFGKDAKAENSAAFLQLRGNANGMDLQFVLTRFAEQTMVGAGVQSAIFDFGFWFEGANVTGDYHYFRASIGLDYAFTMNTFAMVEYHYNGAGSNNPEDYLALFGTLPYQKGGVFLLGEEYLMPALSIQLSPLWSMGLQAIYNLSDDSAFMSISAEYNVAEDFYMDFGFYHFLGDKLTTVPPGIPLLQSEYGTNPDTVYASLRFYF